MYKIIFLSSLASGLMMTGLIWMVQLVQYPGFRILELDAFQGLHRFHVSSISLVVVPLMLIEVLSTGYGALIGERHRWMWMAALALVILIWASTFLFSVPLHNMLSVKWSASSVERLINTNWIRTVAWTFKSGIMLYFLYLSDL